MYVVLLSFVMIYLIIYQFHNDKINLVERENYNLYYKRLFFFRTENGGFQNIDSPPSPLKDPSE